MKSKKWTITMLLVIVLSLAVFAGIMYWMDPLLHYGTENNTFTYYEYGEMYSNPGIAKHYTYDAVMVGTSMVENTDVDLCDELFGCNMVRLPYSGGTTYNMKTILDVCFASGNEIKTVYWELDEFQIFGSATEPRYPLPEYLYRMDHKEDLSYLLNLDILYHYGMNNILGTLRGEKQSAERRGETLTGTFSAEATLAGYSRPEQLTTIRSFSNSTLPEKVDANLCNMEALILAHPETQFVFFMPPFSVLYWDAEIRNGTFESTMDGVEYALKYLLEYENVQIYFYQGDEDIITNLNNYKDYSHYGPWINNLITQYISEGRNQVTKDNVEQLIGDMKGTIYCFDFESLLNS